MFVQLASSLHLPLILLHRHNGAAKRKVCITYNNTARVCPECLDNICYVDNIQPPPPPPPGLTFLLGKSEIGERREARPDQTRPVGYIVFTFVLHWHSIGSLLLTVEFSLNEIEIFQLSPNKRNDDQLSAPWGCEGPHSELVWRLDRLWLPDLEMK